MVTPNPYRDFVNQKLFFARTLLAQVVSVSPSLAERQLGCALVDGAILLLRRAYQVYLQELAANYQCRTTAVTDIKTLTSVLGEGGKTLSETQELENLELDPLSWLSRLLLASAAELAEGSGESLRSEQVMSVGIELKEECPVSPTAEQVLSWHVAFEHLLMRQRALMVEW